MLKPLQQRQLERQRSAYHHGRLRIDLTLTEGEQLQGFTVLPGVLDPSGMTAIVLARWLYFNNGLFCDANVFDIGCGTGLQGIIAGLYGARHVTYSDVAATAVRNTQINVKHYGLTRRSTVICSDLFEHIRGKFSVILFNHPFFMDATNTPKSAGPSSSFLTVDGSLLICFLREAPRWLVSEGRIIMPYFHMAGRLNDPGFQAPKLGYRVRIAFRSKVNTTYHQGPVSIYELSRGDCS